MTVAVCLCSFTDPGDGDGDGDDPTLTASNLYYQVGNPVADERFERFGGSRTDFAILLSQLNRPTLAELFGRA